MVLCLVVNCGRKSGRRGKKRGTEDDDHGPNQTDNEKSSGISFSRVPTIITNEGNAMEDLTRERRRRWISALSRDDLTEKKLANDRVCNLHFVSGRAAKNWDRFNVDWVPTLRLGHTNKLEKDHSHVKERAARVTSRRKRVNDNRKHESEEKRVREDDGLSIASIFGIQEEPMPRQREITSNEAISMGVTVDSGQCIQPAEETRVCDAETNTDELNYLFQGLAIKTEPFTQECFINDDTKVRFYTGLPSYDVLQTTFDFVKPLIDGKSATLQSFQQFILVLMKLRLNVPHQDLAYRFGVSVPTVSRIFKKLINILDKKLSPIISWPEREDLWRTMPKCFQFSFGKRSTLPIDYLICSSGSQSPLIYKILRVTASLTNLCPSIVPFD
eukprot:gene1004-10783_t